MGNLWEIYGKSGDLWDIPSGVIKHGKGWKIAELNGSFVRKFKYKWFILHCHVRLPEGISHHLMYPGEFFSGDSCWKPGNGTSVAEDFTDE